MTSHINISGQDFDKVISKELKVDIKEAEDLKKGIGLINIEKKWKTYRVVVVQKSHSREKSPKSRIDLLRAMKEEKIFDALVPILTDLAEQVQHYVEYFKDFGKVGYVPDGKIDKIFLCGGEASLIGLPKFLSSSLKLPVEIGNPLINILPPSEKIFGEIFQGKFLPYATAIGLAIRGAGQNRY
jgi:Tfp pilus assembly PilM family ATPase